MDFLISAAQAAESNAAAPQGFAGLDILILVVFVLIFYFLLWRPQSKRAKDHRELIASLSKGDEVITAGGIYGKITEINDNAIHVAIAQGVEIKIQKASVASVLPKGTIKTSE